MIPLVTAEQMRRIEEEFVRSGGDLGWLMGRAGMEVASRIAGGRRVLILAGPGNNGGDGLAAARIIRERGDEVFVYTFKREPAEEFANARTEDDPNLDILRRQADRANEIVDGLLGIGRARKIEGRLADIIETANSAQGARRIAIDIPTGVECDSGAVETVSFRADSTVTLGLGKRGLWGAPAVDFAGDIAIADIGLPPGLGGDSGCALATPEDIARLLPNRTRDWNKGKSGRLLVVSGCSEYAGAPLLVANAAYRAGAGLVDLAVPKVIRGSVASGTVESIFAPVLEQTHLGIETLGQIANNLDQADVIAIGPGLGSHAGTVEMVQALLPDLKQRNKPTLVDADGLNALSKWDRWYESAPESLVITPHPGEMARLLKVTVREVQSNRFSMAQEGATRWGCVVVLKGANSIIATPSGRMWVNPVGGPNLAAGGTGDVLTGIIGALLAQRLAPEDAALAGSWIHGAAGDELRGELGDSGTLASDLWTRIPTVKKRIQDAS